MNIINARVQVANTNLMSEDSAFAPALFDFDGVRHIIVSFCNSFFIWLIGKLLYDPMLKLLLNQIDRILTIECRASAS